MSEKRHRCLTAALALTAALSFTLPAAALPFGTAREPGLAGWTLDSIFDWFQSLFATRWAADGEAASVEKLGSVGGSGSGGSGGTGGSTGSGGTGANIIPDGSPAPGSP